MINFACNPQPTFDLFLTNFNCFGVSAPLARPQFHNTTRKRQRGGQKRGGGQNLTRRTPTENSFRPPHLGTFCPPPYGISLSKSLRSAQNFPQLTSSETAFGGSQNSFRRAILARFCFSVRFAPPLALPSTRLGSCSCFSECPRGQVTGGLGALHGSLCPRTDETKQLTRAREAQMSTTSFAHTSETARGQ